MLELIRREIKAQKENFLEAYNQIQVAYNNFGHLTIRLFKKDDNLFFDDATRKVVKLEDKKTDKDVLIVFTAEQTRQIVAFMRKLSVI